MFEIPRPIPAARPRLRHGLRPLAALLAALALLVGLAGPTAAESTTVSGAAGGPLKKMFVTNGQDAVVAKLYGPGGKCSKVKQVDIRMSDKDGTEFTAIGACHPGNVWGKSLDLPTSGVSCPDFKLAYDATGKFWRFQVPRSCLEGLGNGIRVLGELVTWANAVPGEAGPTSRLARG